MYYPIHINGFTSRTLQRTIERQPFKSMSVFNVSMWSSYYDPFMVSNYYGSDRSVILASLSRGF